MLLKVKTLYQTLEDRGNPDEVVTHGPYICKWPNTWLGDGYYFWDTFIENAHWWGVVRYTKQGVGYMICKAVCDFDSESCYDLVGDTEHLLDFHKALELMKKQGKLRPETTVARVMEFIKKNGAFVFAAIRVYGIKSISDYNEDYKQYRHRLIFEIDKPQFIDYKPAIQLCIFKKNGLSLRDFEIEFPDEYNLDYVV